MENQCVTAEQLEAAWTEDIHRLAEEVAEAMNSAQPGRIIADSAGCPRGVSPTAVREGPWPPAEQAGGFFPLGRVG